ncbi:cobalt/nickel transport protein [Anaerobacterium chartisolvens]|uniref:Cobalt transport protein CbiN n=2 Tax=Anaerobacterium chartisolvens TaxID=1297424 RepID=A0A369B5L1_9FIRM|nr:energy-coupling factor ABC transporter substrate-binding protein [Anaerobacterium chartisolvens]RCX16605.1 cobalt/nickel transport protein [Anaerobacterium chartisolvens]
MQSETLTQKNGSKMAANIAMIVIVVALAVLPLFIVKDGEFGGADGKAEEAITEINAEYQPWFSPLVEPKSGEVESLLFALQAAIGAGIIGYGLGWLRGRAKNQDVK